MVISVSIINDQIVLLIAEEGANLGSVLLQEVDLEIVATEVCQINTTGVTQNLHICAGYPEGGKDSCQGTFPKLLQVLLTHSSQNNQQLGRFALVVKS